MLLFSGLSLDNGREFLAFQLICLHTYELAANVVCLANLGFGSVVIQHWPQCIIYHLIIFYLQFSWAAINIHFLLNCTLYMLSVLYSNHRLSVEAKKVLFSNYSHLTRWNISTKTVLSIYFHLFFTMNIYAIITVTTLDGLF